MSTGSWSVAFSDRLVCITFFHCTWSKQPVKARENNRRCYELRDCLLAWQVTISRQFDYNSYQLSGQFCNRNATRICLSSCSFTMDHELIYLVVLIWCPLPTWWSLGACDWNYSCDVINVICTICDSLLSFVSIGRLLMMPGIYVNWQWSRSYAKAALQHTGSKRIVHCLDPFA